MKRVLLRPHALLILVVTLVSNIALLSSQQTSIGPPNYTAVPQTSFSCAGRTAGYYADPEAKCQAYHMCDILEQQYSYLCPSYTLFNQKFMVCDHWHAVNCSVATQYYDLNNKIGQVSDDNTIDESARTSPRPKISSVFKINNDRTRTTTPSTISSGRNHLSEDATRREPRKENNRILRKISQDVTGTKQLPQVLTTPTTLQPFKHSTPISTKTPFQPSRLLTLPETTAIKSFVFRTDHNTTPAPKTRSSTTQKRKILTTSTTTTTTTVSPSTTTEQSSTFPTVSAFNIRQPKLSVSVRGKPVKKISINARGSGLRVKFGPEARGPLSGAIIDGVKFRPLFKRPATIFFDDRNFTISPDVFTPTPATINHLDNDDEEDTDGNVLPIEPPVPFLVPPFKEEPVRSPKNSPSRFPFLSQLLVPPSKGPVILQGENQELRTPLVVTHIRPLRLSSRDLSLPQLQNLEFFIPAPGLQPPLPDNTISDNTLPSFNKDEVKMTMKFPNTSSIRRRRPLIINPNCPRCHPAFLKPNSCQPCVIIK